MEGIVVVDAVDCSEDVTVSHGWDLIVVIVVDVVGLLWLCGSEAATSVARMAFDGLLGLGEMLCDCGCSEAGPQHKLSVIDGLIPGGLCGEASCRMVALYKLWLHLQLIHIVDGFRWWGTIG
jgi:hypothetical protein